MKNIQRFLILNAVLFLATILLSLFGDRIFIERYPLTTVPIGQPLDNAPLIIETKLSDFDCGDNAEVVSVIVDLEISGGTPPYLLRFDSGDTFTSQIGINSIVRFQVKGGETFRVNVSSNTPDGTPSQTKEIHIPIHDAICETQVSTPESSFKATVRQPSYCYNGPTEDYFIAAYMKLDEEVEPIGIYDEWFLVEGLQTNVRCWIKASSLNYSFDPSLLIIVQTAYTTRNTSCRNGPSIYFSEQTIIPEKWLLVINGKNSLAPDWILVTPHDSTSPCWVALNSLSPFDFAKISVVDIQETLTPTRNPLVITTSTKKVSSEPPISITVVGAPTTSVPASVAAPTNVPPTSIPPTSVPPTSIPPTSVPSTATLCWPPGHCK